MRMKEEIKMDLEILILEMYITLTKGVLLWKQHMGLTIMHKPHHLILKKFKPNLNIGRRVIN
mgnify:CR=1 FL=1